MDDTRESLFANVLADPDADAPRLELARFLDAQADPQGELIRLQIENVKELRKYGPTPDYRRMYLRTKELLSQHETEWTREVAQIAAHLSIARGFVEGVTLDAPRFFDAVPRLYKLAPIRKLVLVDAGPLAEKIAQSPLLDQIVSLIFYNQSKTHPIGDDGLRALAASPHVKRMKRLGLTSNDIGPTGLEALAESKRMPELIHVELGGNRIEPPFETYGTDNMTGLVNRQGIELPEAGRQLEAKYGQLAWLHGPSQLARFPPDDSDL